MPVQAIGIAPTFVGLTPGQITALETPISPFSSVTLIDFNLDAVDTLTISLQGRDGILTDGDDFSDLVANTDGTYTLSGTAA